jgi:hypothetical protein
MDPDLSVAMGLEGNGDNSLFFNSFVSNLAAAGRTGPPPGSL